MREDKKKKEDDLDTETTFADMNVEGFRWYRPDKKEGNEIPPLTKEERRAMTRGAISALWPVLLIVTSLMAVLALLAYLWLK